MNSFTLIIIIRLDGPHIAASYGLSLDEYSEHKACALGSVAMNPDALLGWGA